MKDRRGNRARRRGVHRVVAGLLGALVLLMGLQVPAYAADEWVDVSITAAPPEGGTTQPGHVLSGVTQAFTVLWQCSGSNGTCEGGRIEIPVPQGQPGDIALFPADISAVTVNGVTTGSGQLVGIAPDQKIVWDLPASVPTGTSESLTFTLLAYNSVTPNGTAMTPEVTFTTSNTAPATDQTTVIVDATYGIETRKYRMSPTKDPWLDQNVTYRILVGYPGQFSANEAKNTLDIPNDDYCETLGVQALQNVVVVDQLPDGAQFVEATNGGTYDPVTGEVTWNLGDTIVADHNSASGYKCPGLPDWLEVVVKYPKADSQNFAGRVVENTAAVTAEPWLELGGQTPIQDDAQIAHPLRDSGTGEYNVKKQKSYNASLAGSQLSWRGNNSHQLYNFELSSSGSTSGHWSLTDMVPCGMTSPTSVSDTDCSTPAFTDLRFGADGLLPELHIDFVTNTGGTRTCVIPAGASELSGERFCNGFADGSTSLVDGTSGEWITKFSFSEDLAPGSKGKLYVYGKVSPDLPTTNDDAVYQYPDVTRTAVDPRYVVIENCTADNTVTWSGGSMTTNGLPVDPNEGGRCGYVTVAPDPVKIEPEKLMYDPSVPANERPANPSVRPGTTLRVELQTERKWWDTDQSVIDAAAFTPIIEDVLPAGLRFQPDTTTINLTAEGTSASLDAARQSLGEPNVEVTDVVVDGVTRQKVRITFPDVDGKGLGVGPRLHVMFDVTVLPGTAAARYTNSASSTSVEVDGTHPLDCVWGQKVDAAGQVTSDYWAGVACVNDREYNVLPTPAVSVQKQVQGVVDDAFIAAPGIGTTDRTGDASYRLPVFNSGSVALRGIIAYDILPRVGDTEITPGSTVQRGSEFDVHLTGPVANVPAEASVTYSTANNPCRGELVANGARDSAPANCDDNWVAAGAIGDWSQVTALRIDFGSTVVEAGERFLFDFPVTAGEGDLTGIAWNNVAVTARQAADNSPLLPTEARKVGLQLAPDLSWEKVDGGDQSTLLAGSKWELTPVVAEGASQPAGDWPLEIVDCTADTCAGPDMNPEPGAFLLRGIPWGTYDLEEIEAPNGYVLLDAPVRVVIGPGGLNTTEWVYELGGIANFKPGVDVTWTKVDPDKTRLAGSEWELVPVDSAGNPLPSTTPIAVTDCIEEEASDCAGPDFDPTAGGFELHNVPAGTYQLIETKAPAGFVKLAEPAATVTVAGDVAITIGEIENKQQVVPALPLTGGIGSYLFMIGGGLFLGITAFLLTRTMRRPRLA